VKFLSDEIDQGTYQHDSHPMMVQQNKWRAARFGNQAMLVDSQTYQVVTVSQAVDSLVHKLRPTAKELCCESYLDDCVNLAVQPSAAQRQLDILAETGDPTDIVRRMTEEARVAEIPSDEPPSEVEA
jgi:carboxylate-amine ligase